MHVPAEDAFHLRRALQQPGELRLGLEARVVQARHAHVYRWVVHEEEGSRVGVRLQLLRKPACPIHILAEH